MRSNVKQPDHSPTLGPHIRRPNVLFLLEQHAERAYGAIEQYLVDCQWLEFHSALLYAVRPAFHSSDNAQRPTPSEPPSFQPDDSPLESHVSREMHDKIGLIAQSGLAANAKQIAVDDVRRILLDPVLLEYTFLQIVATDSEYWQRFIVADPPPPTRWPGLGELCRAVAKVLLRVQVRRAALTVTTAACTAFITVLVMSWAAARHSGPGTTLVEADIPPPILAELLENRTWRRYQQRVEPVHFQVVGDNGPERWREFLTAARSARDLDLAAVQSIPSLLSDTSGGAFRFDEAVATQAARLLQRGETGLPVNGDTPPALNSDDVQAIQYFFAETAVSRLRDLLGSPRHAASSRASRLIVTVELDATSRRGRLITRGGTSDAEQAVETPFLVSARPVPLLAAARPELGEGVVARNTSNRNEIELTFHGTDAPESRADFIARRVVTVKELFGLSPTDRAGIAEVCFEISAEFDGATHPTVEFATGGRKIVSASGPPPMRLPRQWTPIVIPIDVSNAEHWEALLSIVVRELSPPENRGLRGQSAKLTIRNAYLRMHVPQPDGPLRDQLVF